MNKDITIAAVQTNLFWENAEKNRKHFEDKINSIDRNVDIIVLPEMFSTGFSMTPAPIAESMDGPTVNWMKRISRKVNSVIAGSVIIEDHGQFYNRMLWIDPEAEIEYYDKRHLFSLAGEDECYASGSEVKIVPYKGWKFCLNICYDLRFPVWSRNTQGYDIAMYVANWPKPRAEAWTVLLRARAIENQCYVVGVNRIGVDANQLEYIGLSAMINMEGNYVAEAQSADVIIYAEFNKNNLKSFREKFPFYRDQDVFDIKLQ